MCGSYTALAPGTVRPLCSCRAMDDYYGNAPRGHRCASATRAVFACTLSMFINLSIYIVCVCVYVLCVYVCMYVCMCVCVCVCQRTVMPLRRNAPRSSR